MNIAICRRSLAASIRAENGFPGTCDRDSSFKKSMRVFISRLGVTFRQQEAKGYGYLAAWEISRTNVGVEAMLGLSLSPSCRPQPLSLQVRLYSLIYSHMMISSYENL